VAVATLILAVMSSSAFALTITNVFDYHTYSTGFLTSATGYQIDDSTAGITFDIGTQFVGEYNAFPQNRTNFVFDSPDYSTNAWWVYVRMINTSAISPTNPDSIELNPPNIRFQIVCRSQGATYNLTSVLPNATWNTGYHLFYVDTSDVHGVSIATPSYNGNPLTSPTGHDLVVRSVHCGFQVYPDDWNNSADISVRVSVWNVNPSRQDVCNIDPTVTSIQESALGIVNINYQIWTIMFDIFSVVVILVSVFGIPILLIKLVRWIFDEIKKMLGGRKVF